MHICGCLLSSQAESLFVYYLDSLYFMAVIWGVWCDVLWQESSQNNCLCHQLQVRGSRWGWPPILYGWNYVSSIRQQVRRLIPKQQASRLEMSGARSHPIWPEKSKKAIIYRLKTDMSGSLDDLYLFSARWTFQACYNPSSWTAEDRGPFHPLIRSYESCHRPRHAKHRHRPSMSPHRRKRGPSQTNPSRAYLSKATHCRIYLEPLSKQASNSYAHAFVLLGKKGKEVPLIIVFLKCVEPLVMRRKFSGMNSNYWKF